MYLGMILVPLIKLPDNCNGCWEWTGKKSKTNGYGHKQFNGKTVLAHRWVYSIFNGYIPDHYVIDHICNNPICVNPKHLQVVTQAENVRRSRSTKLNPNQVRCIKNEIANAKRGDRKKIAEKYGVSVGLISDIKYGRAWADVN